MGVRDLIVYLPAHGYSNDDPIYVSWLDDNFFVSDKDTDSFKIATTSGGSTLIQFTVTITEGFVREFDNTSGTTTITGLDHLEGETVKLTSGGSVVATETVSNGSITVSSDVFTYQVGLTYKMKVRTMRLSLPQDGNTVQGRIKRIHATIVRFIRSKLGRAGQEYDGVEYLTSLDAGFSNESTDVAANVRLTDGGFSEQAFTTVISEEPVPFTVLATIISFEIEEKR